METFSLLKYWKGGASLTPPSADVDTTTTAILSAVAQNDIETDEDDDDEGDDGPFFDLEFTVPDEEEPEDSEDANENQNDDDVEEDDDNNNNNDDDSEREFKFTLSPSSNDPNLSPSPSPSDDLFIKGNLLLHSSEPNSKPQLTASLLKSATKFRVFMLGLKKSKPNASHSSSASNPQQPEPAKKPQQRNLFTVKFKVEEAPVVSLFTRDNSSRAGKALQNQKQQNTEESQTLSSASDQKRLMHRYLKMVKPLYIRVSRRYAEKLRLSDQHNVSSPESGKAATPPPQLSPVAEKTPVEADGSEIAGTNVKGQKQGNNIPLPAGLRVVCKHLGKSRSASAAAATSAATAPAPAPALVSSRRRDDSLLQQQDGIQGAILHCKRSFNASRDCESSQLPRCVSDPLHEISPELSRRSTNEGKDRCL